MSEILIETAMTADQVIEKYGKLLGTRSTKRLWEWRKSGRLGFIRRGKGVLHTPQHIEDFLRSLPEYEAQDVKYSAERNEARRSARARHVASIRSEVSSHYGKAFITVGRRDGFRCACCGSSDGDLAIDHIKPVSRGGGNDPDNLQLLCTSCNSKKGKDEIDYLHQGTASEQG